ncbi:MAG TPA: redox-regulated ATPase YchF [Acholeplasmataceae bacterium]|nr:redox-regulated ATPase YchF [Acholeplasmataceae bacterium]
MSLTAGIVGLPNVGKSTLFNAITNAKVLAANYPFATIEPNVGIVEVRDKRVDEIAKIIKPQRTLYTTFSFTDIAGLVKGASLGEGLGNQFLSHIREVDAICHVIRCFEDPDIVHVNGKIDPIGDIETINLELILADLDQINKRIQKVKKRAELKEADAVLEYNALSKILNALENEKFASTANLGENEKEVVKAYNLLTMKPMIYVLNVSETEVNTKNEYVLMVEKYAEASKTKCIVVSAKIEEEISNLDEETRKLFLSELEITESGLDKLVKATYELLGLQTYFTAGEKEVRAWTFKKGMKAPECAGIIHTDFEKGFIRAEVVSYDDFIKYGGKENARLAGKVRLEGKDYEFQDGDIALFRFNV